MFVINILCIFILRKRNPSFPSLFGVTVRILPNCLIGQHSKGYFGLI